MSDKKPTPQKIPFTKSGKGKTRSKAATQKTWSAAAVLIFVVVAACYNLFSCEQQPAEDANTTFPEVVPAPTAGADADEMTVSFLDVDQGDSILIQAEAGTVLIDAGERDQDDVVIADLKKYGVTEIDYIIATHPHSDHIGGLIGVLNYAAENADLTIHNVLIPQISAKMTPTTVTYEKFLNGIAANHIKPTVLKKEQTITLGDHTTMEVFPPVEGDYSSLNDFSLGAYLDCNGKTFLFTGDSESPEEKAWVKAGVFDEKPVDVLKAGHHGSSTSSNAVVLEKIQPKCVVISCGVNNSYKHPHQEAMDRYQLYTNEIYRTDLDGTVICNVIGTELLWSFDTEQPGVRLAQ